MDDIRNDIILSFCQENIRLMEESDEDDDFFFMFMMHRRARAMEIRKQERLSEVRRRRRRYKDPNSKIQTIFITVQCFHCSTMQVKEKKKSSKNWNCVVCNEKQSVLKVLSEGSLANDVEKFVQDFNMSKQVTDEIRKETLISSFEEEIDGPSRIINSTQTKKRREPHNQDDCEGEQQQQQEGGCEFEPEFPKEKFKKAKLMNSSVGVEKSNGIKSSNPISPEESTNIPIISRGSKSRWVPQEDEALCRAFVSISEDHTVEIGQKKKTLWKRIHEAFVADYGNSEGRNPHALNNRFNTIKKLILNYIAILRKFYANPPSGWTELNFIEGARQEFLTWTGKPFVHDHALKILKKMPRFDPNYNATVVVNCEASIPTTTIATLQPFSSFLYDSTPGLDDREIASREQDRHYKELEEENNIMCMVLHGMPDHQRFFFELRQREIATKYGWNRPQPQ